MDELLSKQTSFHNKTRRKNTKHKQQTQRTHTEKKRQILQKSNKILFAYHKKDME